MSYKDAIIGGPQGSPVQPKQAVRDDTLATALQGISGLVSMGATIKGNSDAKAAKQAESLQETETNLAVTAFEKAQAKVALAVKQGMSKEEGRIHLMKNFSKALDDNPELGEKLSIANNRIRSASGLGGFVIKESDEEKRERELEDAVVSEQWTSSNPTPEELAQGISDRQRYETNARVLNESTAEATNLKARLSARNALDDQEKFDLERQLAVLKAKASLSVGDMALSYHSKIKRTTNNIITNFKAGGYENNTQALHDLTMQFSDVENLARVQGQFLVPEQLSSVLAPIQGMKTLAENVIKGTIQIEEYEAKLDILQKSQQLRMLSDNPNFASAVAISNITPQGGVAILNHLTTTSADVFAKEKIDVVTVPEVVKTQVLGAIEGVMEGSIQEGATPEAKQEAYKRVTSFFKGLKAYSAGVERPEDLDKAVRFLASDAFGSYAEANKGIPKEIAPEVKELIQREYEIPVMLRVKNLLEQTLQGDFPAANVMAGVGYKRPDKMLGEIVEPVFQDGRVVFVLKSGAQDKSSRDIAKVNKQLSEVTTRLIRLGSHAEGSTDYEATWERVKAGIYGTTGDTPEEKGDDNAS